MLYVYLDQNKWIDLAKAACGRTDGLRFVSLLNAAKKAVERGMAVFPLSSAHVMETAKSPKLEQRQQLARLMSELSQGIVLRTSSRLVREYLPIAVRSIFGETVETPTPAHFSNRIEDAFDFDLTDLLGISPERAEVLRMSLDSPAAWCDLLAHHHESERKAGSTSVNAIGSRMALKNEEWRKVLVDDDFDTIRRAYAATLTMSLLEPLSRHLTAIGRSVQEWGTLGPEKLMHFWQTIPCLHAEIDLHSQKLHEKSKKWETNDAIDIGALSLAIPACDIVVTEKFWTSLIRKRKLDKTFETVVLTNLGDLQSKLEPAAN